MRCDEVTTTKQTMIMCQSLGNGAKFAQMPLCGPQGPHETHQLLLLLSLSAQKALKGLLDSLLE